MSRFNANSCKVEHNREELSARGSCACKSSWYNAHNIWELQFSKSVLQTEWINVGLWPLLIDHQWIASQTTFCTSSRVRVKNTHKAYRRLLFYVDVELGVPHPFSRASHIRCAHGRGTTLCTEKHEEWNERDWTDLRFARKSVRNYLDMHVACAISNLSNLTSPQDTRYLV